MQIYQRFSEDETVYRTSTDDGKRATWYIKRGQMRVSFIDDPNGTEPAVRFSDPAEPSAMIPLPFCNPGHLAFGTNFQSSATLDQARKLAPQHAELWDAVASDYRVAIVPKSNRNGCIEGRTFSPAEERAFLASLKK